MYYLNFLSTLPLNNDIKFDWSVVLWLVKRGALGLNFVVSFKSGLRFHKSVVFKLITILLVGKHLNPPHKVIYCIVTGALCPFPKSSLPRGNFYFIITGMGHLPRFQDIPFQHFRFNQFQNRCHFNFQYRLAYSFFNKNKTEFLEKGASAPFPILIY